MKKYTYTVSGMNTPEDKEKIVSAVKSIEYVKDAAGLLRASCVTLLSDDTQISQDELERLLAQRLAEEGYELILPEGVRSYIPKQEKKSAKKLPVSTVVILLVLTGLFCSMLTFGFSSRLMNPTTDIPDYMSDLYKLDEFFRTHSYNGINNESFGEQLLKAYIAYSGDEYARYYTDEEYNSSLQDKVGQFVGIGMDIKQSRITLNGNSVAVIEILSTYEGSPAREAGLLAGDMISHIGATGTEQSVDSLGYTEATNMLAGEEGSFAEFVVQRKNEAGEYESHSFKVERKLVVRESVSGVVCTTDSKVGILRVRRFDYTTPTQFESAFDKLKEAGCEYFVIDLRDNPGGHVESIVATASYFLSLGDTVMTTENKDGKVVENWSVKTRKNDSFEITKEDIGKYKNEKICVLTNANTASAAELFSATVRDYELGILVGEKTYGKGIMQSTYKLDSYGLPGALKITTHYYFSKSHNSYHGVGITPDIEITLSNEAKQYPQGYIPHNIDTQLQSAIENIKK